MEQAKRAGTAHKIWIAVLAVLSAALLATTLFFALRPADQTAMENAYQARFYELSDTVDGLEVKLSKLVVASHPVLQAELANGVWRESNVAASVLSALPIDHHSIESTYSLVNVLGDYSHTIAGKLLAGNVLTEKEKTELDDLYLRTAKVADELRGLQAEMSTYRFVDHLDYEKVAAGDGLSGKLSADDEAPKLVYDGPFSDALLHPDYSFTEGQEEWDAERAARRAAELFEGEIAYLGATAGDLPCYEFSVGEEGYLQLTTRGGYVVTYDAPYLARQAELQADDAVQAAKRFAEAHYGVSFECVWLSTAGGTAVAELAPSENGTVYYNELVKLNVDLTSGDIVGADGFTFLANRGKHATAPPEVTRSTAIKAVDSRLSPEYVRLAMIPRPGGNVKLAYEFRGEISDRSYLIYVDARTGEELDILRIVQTAEGWLVA